MSRSFANSGRLLMFLFLVLFASQAFGAAGDVLEVNGREIIIEGESDGVVGDELVIHDYDGKKVARVKIREVVRNESGLEYICDLVSGDSDVREGFTSLRPSRKRGSMYLEFSALSTTVRQNSQYNEVTGTVPTLDYTTPFVVRFGSTALGGSLLGDNFFALVSTSYAHLGPYGFWNLIEGGVMGRLPIKAGSIYLSAGGQVGFGVGIGTQKWERPEGEYSDKIGRNSGEVSRGMGLSMQVFTALSYNLSSKLGLQLKAGYYSFTSVQEDSEIPSDVTKGKQSGWHIKDEWLDVNVDNGGITLGASVLVYAF